MKHKQEMYRAEGVTDSEYWIDVNLPFPSKLIRQRYTADSIIQYKKVNPSKKIYLIHFEERLESMQLASEVISDAHLFDFIFTSNRDIVNAVPNAQWTPLAECWTNGSMKGIDKIDRTAEAKEKQFNVSFLTTSKSNHGGAYDIRQHIMENVSDIKIPINFYDSNAHPSGSVYPILPQSNTFQISDKIHLYKSMFNICPENISGKEENFSQRLIDCFINKTIPIYRGYENIHEHFNIDGMIIAKDGDDAITKINKLTPEYYNERLNAINDNYNRCIQNEYHLGPGQRISNIILKQSN